MKQVAPRLRVCRWREYQHYKDRRPPWIKLHVQILEDYEFTRLDPASRMLAIGIMLLASKTENHVPSDPAWLARALHLPSAPDLESLKEAGFIEPCQCERCASKALATRQQVATSETETETETEAEAHTEARAREAGPEVEVDEEAAEATAWERFIDTYPEQGLSKILAAQREFHQLWRNGMLPPTDDLIATVESWKRSRRWQEGGGRYIPGAERWLRDGCFQRPPVDIGEAKPRRSADLERRRAGHDPELAGEIKKLFDAGGIKR